MPETPASPIIYQVNPLPTSNNRAGLIAKVLIGLLMLGLGLFIIWQLYQTWLAFNQSSSPAAVSQNYFDITPESQYSVNQVINLPIQLNTQGQTLVGVDLVINYDPTFIRVTNTAAAPLFKGGSIFAEYPISQVEPNSGQIRISGIASSFENGFNGIGQFGTLNFETVAAGQTYIEIMAAPGETTDSNLISADSGQDILESSETWLINIK